MIHTKNMKLWNWKNVRWIFKLLVEQVYTSLYRQLFKMHIKGDSHAISHKMRNMLWETVQNGSYYKMIVNLAELCYIEYKTKLVRNEFRHLH